jgi:hypothetical protein
MKYDYSEQELNSMEAIGVKPLIGNTDSDNNIDIIEADIKLETKNRNTFINSCLSGELESLNEEDVTT